MKRRVVVTGTGLVTPLGTGTEKSWAALCKGKSGVGLITKFDTSDYAVKIAAEVTDFIEDMASAYAWADVVVCRAGALTVSEVAAAGVAALFIPFPHAVDDHQTRNAEYLVENGAALLVQESQTDARKLARILSPLVGDRARLAEMAMRGRAASVPDSAERVAGLCREYTK